MGRPFSRVGRLRWHVEVNSPEVVSEANLTPLVDMALTLIVVFLIFLPNLTKLIPISSTSNGGGQGSNAQPEAPLVLLLGETKVRMGELEFTSNEKLIPWLRDLFIQRKDHKVIVKSEPAVTQQRLVALLDDIRRTGDWKVSLSVLAEEP